MIVLNLMLSIKENEFMQNFIKLTKNFYVLILLIVSRSLFPLLSFLLKPGCLVFKFTQIVPQLLNYSLSLSFKSLFNLSFTKFKLWMTFKDSFKSLLYCCFIASRSLSNFSIAFSTFSLSSNFASTMPISHRLLHMYHEF